MAGNSTLRASAWTQMLSTELNSLQAANGYPLNVADQNTATNPAFDNTLSGNLFTRMRIQINFTLQNPPASPGANIDFYLRAVGRDGATYWDDPVAYQAGPLYLGSVEIAGNALAQKLGIRNIPLGYEKFTITTINQTDELFVSSGNTVWILCEADAYT